MSNNNTDNPVESQINNWDDLNLNETLLWGIYSCGFEKPSEIQKKAILPIINGNDVIAQAQSGTGKTGAFTVSALQCVDTELKETQTIIIAPTRELASQIFKVLNMLSEFFTNLKRQIPENLKFVVS